MKILALCFALVSAVAVTATADDAKPAGVHNSSEHPQLAITPAAARERLEAGNARFVANKTTLHNWPSEVAATAAGQSPFAALLGCMDSRVPGETIFDQGIGDLFDIRVAGNVVNDDELGSLEYAAKHGIKLIVVMGHTKCGAVTGALEGAKLGSLTGLLAKIEPAEKAAGCHDTSDACVTSVAEANVRESMKQIRARSSYLSGLFDENKIEISGAMYDVATGKVRFLGN